MVGISKKIKDTKMAKGLAERATWQTENLISFEDIQETECS